MVQKKDLAGEQATQWDIQNKATSSSQIEFSLFSPARCFLYHETGSCKGPIVEAK